MTTSFSKALIVTASLMSVGFAPAGAEDGDITITQKNKTFSEKKITISKDQPITFVNDDNVAHNIYTIVDGNKKDLGLQRPGDSGQLSFDADGRYRVRCAIHPKMKMTVVVE